MVDILHMADYPVERLCVASEYFISTCCVGGMIELDLRWHGQVEYPPEGVHGGLKEWFEACIGNIGE